MKKEKPKFYATYKNPNTGKLELVDVLDPIFSEIIGKTGRLNKKKFYRYDEKYNKISITTKQELQKYLNTELLYRFWGKCEWEYVVVDWPHMDKVDNSRPHKVSVYDQVKPNIEAITNLVWDYIKDKI